MAALHKMATTSAATLTWAPLSSSSSLLKHSQTSPTRAPILRHHRILPVTPSSSLPTPPSCPLVRVQYLHRNPNPFSGSNSHKIQSRSPLSSSHSNQQQSGKQFSRSASSSSRGERLEENEEVFFDGGVHYGDLLANLVFGLTLVWLPLTIAAIFRNLFLRYRFTNLRITIQSGLLGDDRKDFSYDVVKDVKFVPRFIGEWGDMAIELQDGTKLEVRCVPKFREIAKYIEERVAGGPKKGSDPSVLSSSSSARRGTPKKGFS